MVEESSRAERSTVSPDQPCQSHCGNRVVRYPIQMHGREVLRLKQVRNLFCAECQRIMRI